MRQLTRILELLPAIAITYSDIPRGLDNDTLFVLMNERAMTSRRVYEELEKLISSSITPYLKEPKTMNATIAHELETFANTIFSLSLRLDTGFAYEIYSALVIYAQDVYDRNLLIRSLYHKALSLYHLDNTPEQYDILLNCYTKAADFRHVYYEIDDKYTRSFIHRALANVCVTKANLRSKGEYEPFFKAVDETYAFWNNAALRAFDPDLPYDSYVSGIEQNIISFLDVKRNHLKTDSRFNMRIYNAAFKQYELISQGPEQTVPASVTCSFYEAQGLMGFLSREMMTERIFGLFEAADINDYSSDNIFCMINTPWVAMAYYEDYAPIADIAARGQAVITRQLAYLRGMPASVDAYDINRMIAKIIEPYRRALGGAKHARLNLIDTIMELTVYRHPPTYVHSFMVCWLSEMLCDYLLTTHPDFFIGLFGFTNKQTVLANGALILQRMRLCSLAHDAGKLAYINAISVYARRLNDLEFNIIKRHAKATWGIFHDLGEDEDCIAEVALRHHLWHDRTRGYPDDVPPPPNGLQPLIDILSVADSIDAATDRVGRSYAMTATLHKVIGEIEQGAGTRYNAVIAHALSDPQLIAQFNTALISKRKEAYAKAYRHAR